MSLQPTADTKKLRNMLSKNGIKWDKSMYLKDTLVDCETTWEYDGIKWCAYESPYGGLILRTVDYTLAPEQVAEVMCTRETPDGLPIGLTISNDGNLLNWMGENYVRQDAATIGAETCYCTTPDTAWCFSCSSCGKSFPRNELHMAYNHGEINYCPNCGRRCVG